MTESTSIEVRINGKDRQVSPDLSVSEVLVELDLNPALVVVELNGEILDRAAYNGTRVEEKDVLELVHFVGGG
jgi:sulfur carrier protein